jgi:hypothetical protein
VIPVIKGATGTYSKSFRTYLSNVPGKHEIKEIQKQSYWTLHTYFGKYQCKSTKHIYRMQITLQVTMCKYRTAVTLYTLETWSVIRYITVNTLHKGGNKYSNNNNNNNNNNSSVYLTSHKEADFHSAKQ